MKKIAYLRNASKGVHYHRLEVPFSYLSNQYEVTEVDVIPIGYHDYDVVVMNRFPPNIYPYGAFEKLKKQGVKFIYDLDDYWTRPKYNPNFIENLEKSHTIEILKYLRLADVVWTSTNKLRDLIAPINNNVVVVPNCLDYDNPMWQRRESNRDLVTYGYIGGVGHHKDFETVIEYFRRPYKAKPILCGVEVPEKDKDKPLKEILPDYWKYLGNIITGGKWDRVTYASTLSPREYGVWYNEIDIKILPSANDLFSSCKSNLKILEAGAHKLPVITNNGIYTKELNGRGVIAENPITWSKAMNRLIESKAMREDYGESLYEYTTEKYNIHNVNLIRQQTIDL